MTPQAVGAFGEKAVESELLRRGWVPANLNATVKNAATFDIFAMKGDRTVHLRVKASGPTLKGDWQFGQPRIQSEYLDSDYTILVSVGADRRNDTFYVVPTSMVHAEIMQRKADYLAQPKRDGNSRKESGFWTLRLRPRADGRVEGGWNLQTKWKQYCENWGSLERPIGLLLPHAAAAKQRDRRVVGVEEFTDDEMARIEQAEVSAEHAHLDSELVADRR